MNFKNESEHIFCSDDNLDYLRSYVYPLKITCNDLVDFISNYKGYCTPFPMNSDVWNNVKSLNKIFIDYKNNYGDPSTATTYSSLGEAIFFDQEVRY